MTQTGVGVGGGGIHPTDLPLLRRTHVHKVTGLVNKRKRGCVEAALWTHVRYWVGSTARATVIHPLPCTHLSPSGKASASRAADTGIQPQCPGSSHTSNFLLVLEYLITQPGTRRYRVTTGTLVLGYPARCQALQGHNRYSSPWLPSQVPGVTGSQLVIWYLVIQPGARRYRVTTGTLYLVTHPGARRYGVTTGTL